MAEEQAYVQVALDGAGKKLRNVLVRGALMSDGTRADVYVQCTQALGDDGKPLGMGETNDLLRILIREMQALRMIQGNATGFGFAALQGAMGDETQANFGG